MVTTCTTRSVGFNPNFTSRPIERVFHVRGLCIGIREKIVVEIRQVLWQGFVITEHVGELLRAPRWDCAYRCKPLRPVALALVGEKTLQHGFLQELIHLFVHVAADQLMDW